MNTYEVRDINGKTLGFIETTCLKYAERIAKETYEDYHEIIIPYL